MKKLELFLQEKMLPVAGKLGSNKGLIAIRDGITLAMPLIIIGSLLMVGRLARINRCVRLSMERCGQ